MKKNKAYMSNAIINSILVYHPLKTIAPTVVDTIESEYSVEVNIVDTRDDGIVIRRTKGTVSVDEVFKIVSSIMSDLVNDTDVSEHLSDIYDASVSDIDSWDEVFETVIEVNKDGRLIKIEIDLGA